jgi:calcineurin-like phosphoesterase family protein
VNILGNHDIEKRELLKLAVDEVAPCLEAEFNGEPLFFSHYPAAEHVLVPGQLNVHGHIHDTPFPKGLADGSRHVNMCVEKTGFAPVSLDWLLSQPR